MTKPLIVIDKDIPFIKGRLEPVADTRYLDQDEFTPDAVADADAMIIRTRTRCDRSLLEGSRVGFIATATIGMDQFDLPWLQSVGIGTANAPGCNAPGVAQYVWSSLLHLGVRPDVLKLGVVGCGNVGSIVADWGRKMGAEVLVSDPPRQVAGIPDNYAPLDRIMSECDVVTLHTPLIRTGKNPTFHLIGDGELRLMREGGILVNAARGPVVDFNALSEAIDSKDLQAVIDTWEGEPTIDPALLDKVKIGTFHIAGYSLEGKQRATRMSLEAMERYFGFEVDKSGLAEAYALPRNVEAAIIKDSYDPFADMALLKKAPDRFDRLRAEYNYRREPVFNINC